MSMGADTTPPVPSSNTKGADTGGGLCSTTARMFPS
jgi:hypothetical protein